MIAQFERKQIGFGKMEYQVWVNQTYVGAVRLTDGAGINMQSDLGGRDFFLSIPTFFGAVTTDGPITRKEAGVFDLNGSAGCIYDCGKRGSNIFNGIGYWSFCCDGNVLDAYEVGFGKKGTYCCVWSDDQLIAIISKALRTKHFETGYIIYLEDETYFELLVLINAYWDMTRNHRSGSASSYSTLHTPQKELKNKYDPNFILRIVAMEEQN